VPDTAMVGNINQLVGLYHHMQYLGFNDEVMVTNRCPARGLWVTRHTWLGCRRTFKLDFRENSATTKISTGQYIHGFHGSNGPAYGRSCGVVITCGLATMKRMPMLHADRGSHQRSGSIGDDGSHIVVIINILAIVIHDNFPL
jgi:hypothetical protein